MGRRKAKPSDTPAAEAQPAIDPAARLRRRVVFSRAHRHAGKDLAAGDSYYATDREVELLQRFSAAEVA